MNSDVWCTMSLTSTCHNFSGSPKDDLSTTHRPMIDAETLGAIVVRDVAREAPSAFAKIHPHALIENLKYGWYNSTRLVFQNYCWFQRVEIIPANFVGWAMLIDIYLVVNFSNLWLDSDRRDAIECQEVYTQPLCCSQKSCQLPSSSVTCRVGSASVQQIFFISTRDALKGVLPVHVLSESLLCANFLSVPRIIVWNALPVIFMCIRYPLPDFQAVRFSDVWPGLRKTIRIAAVWSLNIIELFRKMSAHLLSIRWGGIL